EVEEAQEKLLAAEAAIEVERLKLGKIRDLEPDFGPGIRQAEAAVERQKVDLELAKYALEQTRLVAPGDGVILRVMVREGAQFGPQTSQPAIVFQPEGTPIVRASVEQEFAHRIQIGQPVRLYDAHGAQPE